MASNPPLRLGTRGSRLALWQAHHVRDLLAALPDAPLVEIVEIVTSGDIIQNVPLSAAGGRDFFTKDIEDALLDDRIDFAVHSLKDLATRLPEGLELAAVLERRARVCILDRDVFINVAGGVRIQDRSADLAVALALASSAEDWCLDRSTLFLGEVGLGGEIRPVRQATPRSAEAAKLGFTKTWGPARSRPEGRAPTRWRGIDDLAEAVAAARPKGPPS